MYAPPAPNLALQIDGKAVAAGDEVTTKNAMVLVGASVKPGPEGGASVTLSTSGPGGDKPLSLVENPPGEFAPTKVALDSTAKTTIRVTATTRGDGVDSAIESHAVEVTVRQLPPDPVVPPTVRVKFTTPHDPPNGANGPFLANAAKATVTATVEDTNPVTAFDWDIGDGKGWVAGKLDGKSKTATQEVALPADGNVLTVRARAKSKDSKFAEDAVRVVFTGLPDIAFAPPPATVARPDLLLMGTFEVTGTLPFELAVVVTSGKSGSSREFKADTDQKAQDMARHGFPRAWRQPNRARHPEQVARSPKTGSRHSAIPPPASRVGRTSGGGRERFSRGRVGHGRNSRGSRADRAAGERCPRGVPTAR